VLLYHDVCLLCIACKRKEKGMRLILKKIKNFFLVLFERAVSYPVTTVLMITGIVTA